MTDDADAVAWDAAEQSAKVENPPPLQERIDRVTGVSKGPEYDKAQAQLGWRPRYSNQDALVRNYRWYTANADRLAGAGVTHRVPWKQGALALAKLAFPRRA